VLYLALLIVFLIQFLVVLGALMFVIFLARPEVPFSGDKSLKATPTQVQGVRGGNHNPDRNSTIVPPPRCRFSMIQ
jgi:hypothetical protein